MTVRHGSSPPPRNPGRHIVTFWTLRTPTGHLIRCEAHELDRSFELRAIHASQEAPLMTLDFRGPGARAELEQRAVQWRLALIDGGCVDASTG
jgi:hypothetical protein